MNKSISDRDRNFPNYFYTKNLTADHLGRFIARFTSGKPPLSLGFLRQGAKSEGQKYFCDMIGSEPDSVKGNGYLI